MVYDFTTLPDRWNAGAFKYEDMKRKKPDVSRDAVPLSVADMEFLDPPEVVEGLKTYLDHTVLGYTGPTDEYYAAVANWMERRHGFRPERDWFITSPGIVPALFELVKSLTRPGEGVLMMSPVYHPFRFAAQEQGREAIFCPLVERERTYDIDFESFGKLCARPEVKLFLLCSPHNPVGRIWTRDELLRLSEICLDNGVVMVADEIHGDLIIPGYTFTSVGTLPERFVKNAVICTAPSKTFNLAGMQCSNLFAADEALRNRLKKEGHYPTLTALGYESCRLAYTCGEPWLEALRTVLGENKQLVERYLAERVPQIKPFELMGTYLMWLDCRGLGLDKDALERAMIEGELFFDEGYIFGPEGAGFERLNLACPGWVLQKALDKLAAVVRRTEKVKRLLITGFAPFAGDGINPSWQAVQALPETVGAWELYKKELPVSFRGAPEALREAIAAADPDAVLMIGLAAGRDAVTPERQGFNEIDARIPDNEGNMPQNVPVVPGGPETLYATLPVEDMTDAILSAGIPARLSENAGRFVCNALLYSALYRLEQADDPIPAAFIHIPATPELAEGRELPALPPDQIVAALMAAIQAV